MTPTWLAEVPRRRRATGTETGSPAGRGSPAADSAATYPAADGGEQGVVHGRPEGSHARLECRQVGVHEGDPVPRAALTEQHRRADPAADERRQHALKAEAEPPEDAPRMLRPTSTGAVGATADS